jgi:hypothetical protein
MEVCMSRREYRLVPSPAELTAHLDREVERAERAYKQLDPGEVLAGVDDRIAQEPDPTKHPLYAMVQFFLDRQPAVDGAQLYDDYRRLILAAIDACVDALLEMED